MNRKREKDSRRTRTLKHKITDLDLAVESDWIVCHANTEARVVACGPKVKYNDIFALKITSQTRWLLKAAFNHVGTCDAMEPMFLRRVISDMRKRHREVVLASEKPDWSN